MSWSEMSQGPHPPGWIQNDQGDWDPPPPGYTDGDRQARQAENEARGDEANSPEAQARKAEEAKAAAEAAAKAEAERKLNAHFQYGGYENGAADAAARYAKIGADAQGRKGEQINTGRSNAYGEQAQGNAAAEGRVADLMWNRATGKTPSIAGMRADEDMRRLSAAQTSAAASARGPAGIALAQQGAAANTANGTSQISNIAQINSAQERSDAEKSAYSAYSGMRGQDFQGQSLEQQAAQKQAEMNQAARDANDRLQLGMTGAEVGVNKSQLDAQGNQIAIATGAQTAANNLAGQKDMHSDDRLDKYLAPIIGGAAVAGGTAIVGSLMPGGKGGNGSGTGGVGGTTGGNGDGGGGGGGGGNWDPGGYYGQEGNDDPNKPVMGKPVPLPPIGSPSDTRTNSANTFDPNAPPPSITSDENLKEGFANEGGGPNRVDAFLDGIHPLSYHYKRAESEPRSTPTGGRYLGISAQDLEAVPDVGRQMVSDGPRGKQIESGPTLSAALAGLARLHERVKGLEGPGVNDRGVQRGERPMNAYERSLADQGEGMREGITAQDTGASVGKSRVAMDDPRQRAGLAMLESQRDEGEARLAGGPSVGRETLKPFRVTHEDGRTMMIDRPGQDFDSPGRSLGPMTARERALLAQADGMQESNRAQLADGPSVSADRPIGAISKGNIEHMGRPEVDNHDGTTSTVRSMSFNDGPGREVLIPTAYDGAVHSDDDSIANYRKTGQHMGVFRTPEFATAHAEQVHDDYENGKYRIQNRPPPDWLRREMGRPPSIAETFTSDIRAKEDVTSEGGGGSSGVREARRQAFLEGLNYAPSGGAESGPVPDYMEAPRDAAPAPAMRMQPSSSGRRAAGITVNKQDPEWQRSTVAANEADMRRASIIGSPGAFGGPAGMAAGLMEADVNGSNDGLRMRAMQSPAALRPLPPSGGRQMESFVREQREPATLASLYADSEEGKRR